MLIKEEVQHIADLARIELTNQETEKYQEQLGHILDYMEKLKEVDIASVTVSDSGTNDLENIWREDAIKTQDAINNSQENETNLIDMAPSVENRQVKVKSVF
ncbi:MAG TPA: Asp-tRNA(Asn)/Glu-tRNA(Gln) amidotransferase subunit GatC [bacterium]|nr:Asp-tRNA(Asn)/Glu-tRNA(Gln) amidotransferase subunit GatC [bacterium]